MITIQDIYDKVNILPIETIQDFNSSIPVITYFGEIKQSPEDVLQDYVNGSSFDFWDNERDETDGESLSDK